MEDRRERGSVAIKRDGVVCVSARERDREREREANENNSENK